MPRESAGLTADPAELTANPAIAGTEQILAEVLADVVQVERVPADSHFFRDLGADSLVMAHFCARIRKRADVPSVSMRDIYRHPTLRSLATSLAETAVGPATPAAPATPAEVAATVRTREYVLCGALQALFFLGYAWVAALAGARAYDWISTASGLGEIYLRSVLFGGASFLVVCLVPIGAKWMLIGRWKPRQIRVWSLGYVRFWIVRTLVRSNPLSFLTVGSPLYPLYLRALGARIGPGTAILSRNVPVCTDLGDQAQLGHASALYRGQAIPGGQHWHGSPAQHTELNYLRVSPAADSTLRRVRFSAFTLFCVFFLYLPLAEGGVFGLLTAVPMRGRVLDPTGYAITSRALYIHAIVLSGVLFFGLVTAGLLLVTTVPRLLNLFIKPGVVYPLYGFHDRIHRAIARMTGVKFFTHLFGDSSYIVWYLRWLGYDLSEVEQTGSNFGTEVGHETLYLSTIGSGTMVADGLSLMNADFSATSFQVSRVSIGARNFVGNNIAYPAGGRTGENCLLATKTMIPLDGEIREGVGLLGSPCFEIPRSVERDSRFDELRTGDELRRWLAGKNRYNLRTMAFFLLTRWLHLCLVAVFALAAFDAYGGLWQLEMAVLFALSVLVTPVYFVLLERGMKGFRRLQPKYCSIYDPYFWRHERLWKVPGEAYLKMFDGTPFKNMVWRGLGVRLGKRVFDDGCYLTERTLTSIGDDCMLNAGTKVQCHSQEDGTFKSDRTTIGAGCTLGVGAMVHYGVTIGDGSVLAPDSFLMKGEEIPAHARWGGNPAREM